MLLYDIKPSLVSGFATFYAVHVPWRDPREGCPKCYLPIHRERTGPYTIQWESGSDIIPDFHFCMRGDTMLVSDRVKVAFEQAGLKGFVAWPLKIQEPKRVPKRSRIPRVPSPYPGPTIWDLYVTDYVHLIPERSTFCFDGVCPKCGQKQYDPYGAPEQHWFVVDRSTWTGVDFMRPHELNTILVTERVIEIVKAHGFTNARIHQLGEMGEPGETPISQWRMVSVVEPPRAGGEEEPDPYDDLKRMSLALPRLDEDSPRSCPEAMKAILKYVRMESGDDTLRASNLQFIRTTRMKDTDYWVWRFEEQDGTEAYVTVSRRPDGSTCVGYNTNDFSLTPEQFVYGDYHEVF